MGASSAEMYLENLQHWCVHPNQYLYDENNSRTDRRDALWYEFPDKPEMTEDERNILEFYRAVVRDDPNNILRSSLKVSSFTTNPLNALMWEQYAGKSQGICVEYDVGANLCFAEILRSHLFPMIYRERPEKLTDFVLEGNDPGWTSECGKMFIYYFGILISTLKDAQYSYEDEWRCLICNSEEANPNPVTAQCGTLEDMYSEQDETESQLPDDFSWGCNIDGSYFPKNIYLGEMILNELREKTIQRASSHSVYVYQVHMDGESLSTELVYDPSSPMCSQNH